MDRGGSDGCGAEEGDREMSEYVTKEATATFEGKPYPVVKLLLAEDDPNHLAAQSISGQKETWLSIPKEQFSLEKVREYEKRGFKFRKRKETQP